MNHPDTVLDCADLSLSRGRRLEQTRVVDGVSFELRRAHTLAVMGATGSGKSSLVSALAGSPSSDVRISGGRAHVLGVSIRAGGRARKKMASAVGYVPQSAGAKLSARLTAADLIAEPVVSRSRKVNRRALDVKVVSLLDELMLPIGTGEKFPFELSSGTRQRVAFARALIEEPLVFIGDEPFANMDVDARRAASEALIQRRDEYGMSTLLVAHEADVVARSDAAVVGLRAGHMVAAGPSLDELTWTPGLPPEHRHVVLSRPTSEILLPHLDSNQEPID